MVKKVAKKKGRPPMVGGGDGEDIYFRASRELANLLDSEVEKRKKQHPGLPISRAGLIRELLLRSCN